MTTNPKYSIVEEKESPPDLYRTINQSTPLTDYNPYLADDALRQAIHAYDLSWAEPSLCEHGKLVGGTEAIKWGFDANYFKPILRTYDRQGNRIDCVEYHDAYHNLMRLSLEHGTHSDAWNLGRPGAHVVRAARAYLQVQVDAGHDCPVGMTYSCIPSIRLNPALAAQWLPRILTNAYDPRNIPFFSKSSATIGMAMTEKQGGSDVRANITSATFLGPTAVGDLYNIKGHKWFTSAPMCDAFLVLARTDSGISCFLVPRWREDGVKNPMEIQRLKDKMGNTSNASSEIVFRGAHGWLIGEEGAGIQVIMQMVALTRLDCMIQGAAGQRQAVSQAINHTLGRKAFGRLLIDQPLMRNVLADLQLEVEGSVALLMRMAKAMDGMFAVERNEADELLLRTGLAIGKYWITKRASAVTYEALECLGGNGAIEEYVTARLYRDAPINAIWEGAGNIQALDIKRAIERSPRVLDVFFTELESTKGVDTLLDKSVNDLYSLLHAESAGDQTYRIVIERMALVAQSHYLLKYGDARVANVFIQSRLTPDITRGFGTLMAHREIEYLIDRGNPTIDTFSAEAYT